MLNTKSFFYKIHAMIKKRFLYAAIIALGTLGFISCTTTSKAQKAFEEAEPYTENYITNINRNLSYTKEQFKNEKFLFIRMHHINYNEDGKILYYWRTLASWMGQSESGDAYTHTALNYTLKDDFIGITTQGENQVKYERFGSPMENPYFSKIDMDRTSCLVLAIPVSESDWENCKALLEYSMSPKKNFKFSKTSALSVPFKHRKARKLLKTTDFKNNNDYEKVVLADDYSTYFEKEYKFACSGYIMKILSTGTSKYNNMFNKNKIKATAYAPSDLLYLDQIQPLFTCRASQYDRAVEEYLKIYPEFSEYFSKK